MADITHGATWTGFVYVAFVIGVFSRSQALAARAPDAGLIHHSDRGVRCLSIRYTDRLTEAGIVPPGGSVGDFYDNAMAVTIDGLHKTEAIRKDGPWRGIDPAEYATLAWVDWFNNRRLLGPIGDIPPAGFEKMYHDQNEEPAVVAGLDYTALR